MSTSSVTPSIDQSSHDIVLFPNHNAVAAIPAHIDDDKEKRAQTYQFELDERSWITDVLERAASVKIDDPPGTPPRSQLQFYPPPLVDPHRVTHAPIVQPHDPYPVPPPP